MRNVFIACCLLLLWTSCSETTENPDGRPSIDDLKAQITEMDDSLKVYYAEVMNGNADKVPMHAIEKTIGLHFQFYHYYPNDEFAPECLDKIHQLHLQNKEYTKSVQMCDTLIAKYPTYKKRNEIYLSAGSTYDYFLRDSTHAKKYYELLLKNPKLDQDTRESVQFRLKHLSLSLDEMIALQMKK